MPGQTRGVAGMLRSPSTCTSSMLSRNVAASTRLICSCENRCVTSGARRSSCLVEASAGLAAAMSGVTGASSSAAADSLIKIAATNAEVTTKAQRILELIALPTVSFHLIHRADRYELRSSMTTISSDSTMTAASGGDSLRGALSHLRVLDMSRVLAGPWCGQILADLGAEVIKIERPGVGDDTRSWGPPYLKDREGNDTRESAYFLGANRGKKSVTLDISKPAGQEIARRLAASSDVLIENYKAGDLTRYNLGYEQLKTLNPGLIYCSITGFGQTGPMKQVAGYDFIIQAMGGLMSVTGERDELPGGGPQKVGVAVADITTGMYSTVAILAALAHRSRTGQGQYIDMALLDSQVAMIANMNMNYLVGGKAPKRMGNAHANIVPYQVFDASDGQFVVAVGNDGQFAKFCEAAGQAFHR